MENMKQKLRTGIDDLLREFIEKRIRESYNKIYTGKVINNNDPEKKYRCRIRVYGIYGKEIPDDDLPWAMGDMGFVGSKIGSVVIPPVDSIVRVYFDNGDIYKPIYTTKIFDANNISDEASEDYPDTMVLFETDEGEYFKINRKTNETTYHSATGVLLTIDKEGSVTLSTEDTTKGDITFKDRNDGADKTNKIEMTSTGITIEDRNGNKIEMLDGGQIKITTMDGIVTGGSLTVNGVAAPNAGPFCALPNCLFTGAPHTGNKVTGT